MRKKLAQRQDIEPDDDESYSDFMDRCSDEIGDEDVCHHVRWLGPRQFQQEPHRAVRPPKQLPDRQMEERPRR
jgi:hypothetical protein